MMLSDVTLLGFTRQLRGESFATDLVPDQSRNILHEARIEAEWWKHRHQRKSEQQYAEVPAERLLLPT